MTADRGGYRAGALFPVGDRRIALRFEKGP